MNGQDSMHGWESVSDQESVGSDGAVRGSELSRRNFLKAALTTGATAAALGIIAADRFLIGY